MISRAWYLVAVGFFLAAVAIAMIGFTQMMKRVEEMHRVVMPGKAEVVLPAGVTTLYAESSSIVDGKSYLASPDFTFRCAVTDPSGKQMPIARPGSSVTYGTGDYAGHNAFDVQIEVAGTYVLTCESPNPFVMAIGRGIGTWIVVAMIALVPAGLGIAAFMVVLVLRLSRKKRVA